MAGTNAGTGQPITFLCAIERREKTWVEYGFRAPRDHTVVRTGRERPYFKRRGNIRMDAVTREYRCSCGHVGWSAHKDLARHPEDR